MASSSSSSSNSVNFDVFLSFRGADTRKNFTDHVYVALTREGFRTFRDEEELTKGEVIREDLFKAIEGSRIAIPIFSPNYANSGWCLDELSKIVECEKSKKLTVLPVFYKVTPSEVRKVKGVFGQGYNSFSKNKEDDKRWRSALRTVADLVGVDCNNQKDGYEARNVQSIVEEVSKILKKVPLDVREHPIAGINSQYSDSDMAESGVLFSGTSLLPNNFLQNGRYRLIMQRDCNLVLYVDGNKPLWSSGTNNTGTYHSCRATLHDDGRLVVLLGTSELWSSGLPGRKGKYRLVMQNDGNAVIYDSHNLICWSSGKSVLLNGASLLPDQFLENGPFRLVMQSDNNLVLYFENNLLWASGTSSRRTNCRATLLDDGRLVVLSGSNQLWSSGPPRTRNSYRLILQRDGNAVIYDAVDKPVWATNTVRH